MWGEYVEVVRNTVLIPKARVKSPFVWDQSLIPWIFTPLRRGSQVILRINCSVWSCFRCLNHLCPSLLFFIYLVLMLFICSQRVFFESGLKLIAPLGWLLSLSFVSLSLWFLHKQKAVGVDSDVSAKQQGTYQIKESSSGLIKPKTHLVNLVVIDVDHLLKKHSCAQG